MARVDPEFVELAPDAARAGRLLALHARDPQCFPVLLDSSLSGDRHGRFTLLLGAPGERLTLGVDGSLGGPGIGNTFCTRLDDWWREQRGSSPVVSWPFTGGWFLFLGYELTSEIEPSLCLPRSPLPLVALAWRMRAAILHDHASGRGLAVAEPGAGVTAGELCAALASAASLPSDNTGPIAEVVEENPQLYLSACRLVLEHIAAGDVYQVNLARRWRARLEPGASVTALYARLRGNNPGAFSGSARLGGIEILSSSPERLVRVCGRRIDTRPIAGTRPRVAGQDAASIAALFASAKERAEHVMLIDLERNDLGRLCEPGSVRVDEFMAIESYAHVHHLVSSVTGQLREDGTPGQVVRALFPGGTITGCPKVRCMQLIADLEGRGRGAYTGAMGYLARDGSMDLNILIRTLTVRDGIAELLAGAGIVADSDPWRELEETRAKARGVLAALNGAG